MTAVSAVAWAACGEARPPEKAVNGDDPYAGAEIDFAKIPDDHTGGWLMLHSPHNGIGFKRSTDLVHWTDCGKTVLGQKDWPWAKGRITAATVIDCRAVKGVGKYVMFFHGSGPRKEIEGDCYKNSSIGIAWSDDLKEWSWPGKAAE